MDFNLYTPINSIINDIINKSANSTIQKTKYNSIASLGEKKDESNSIKIEGKKELYNNNSELTKNELEDLLSKED